MEWNVYYYDFNRNKIDTYNVLNHYSFFEDVKKIIKKHKTKEEFTEQLRKEVRYYFWSRCEWELIIEITKDNRIYLNPWIGNRDTEKTRIDVTDNKNFNWKNFAEEHTKNQICKNKVKIDVFDQIKYNWEDFVDYVWDNRNLF